MTPGRSPPSNFVGTDRFRIGRELGSGGMGVVYEAFDRERRTNVALKTLRWADPSFLYRFKREFRAAQEIDHPNLVQLGELFEEDGRWFFTMELVEGVGFISHVRPGGQLDEERARDALPQLARALAAIHDAGKVHRDIKPSNIMVEDSGRVVVLDFGLVFDLERKGLSDDTTTVGTAEYMAPEQAAAKPVGPEADWYSLGVIMFEMLTGELPFVGSTLEIMMEKQERQPPPPSSIADWIPEDLDQLCSALLRFAPGDRPTRAEIFDRLGIRDRPALHAVATPRPSHYTPFVGRDDELDHLREELAHMLDGGTSAVMVSGASGLGKTALIRQFIDRAREEQPRLTVFQGRCYEREAVSFKAFDGIIDELSRYMRSLPDAGASALVPLDAALLPRMFPSLGRVEVIARAPRRQRQEQRQELRARTFAALRELLSRLAERSPLVLVIDDLQWADADSINLLSELLRPPDPPTMLLLASSRAEADWVTPIRFADVVHGRRLLLRMRPLSIRAATELAERLAANAGVTANARAIAEEARGHPMHIYELVRHAELTGSERTEPLRLEQAICTRAEKLPAPAQLLLELVALAAAPMKTPVVQHAARLPLRELDRAISILRVGQLLNISGSGASQTLEPAHDRVREAIAARMPADRCRDLHERLAIALEIEGGRPEILVRHLEAAGQRAKASSYAREAARRAFDALAFDRAAELQQAALRLSDATGDPRRELLLELGESLVNAGRGLEAASVFMDAAEGGDPATRLDCRRSAAEQLVTSGHIEDGLEALRLLLADIGVSMPDSPQRALRSLVWNRLKLRLRGMRFTPRRESQIARETLLRVDAYKAASHGLAMVDPVRGADFTARYLLLALRTGEVTRLARALGLEIAMCGSQGGRGLRRGRKLLARAEELAAEVDDPYVRGWALSARGVLHYFAGDFAAAAETLDAAVTNFLHQAKGAAWEIVNSRMFHLFALRQLGQLNDLGHWFEQAIREATARGDRYVETSARRYCNLLWLIRDEPDAARANLANAQWSPPVGRFHLQHWFELEAITELAIYEGRAREVCDEHIEMFEALDRSLLPRVQIVRVLSRYVRARLLVASGRDADLAAARFLADRLAREDVPYAAVFAHALRAGVAARVGDTDLAARELRGVIECADQLQMLAPRAVAQLYLGDLTGDGALAEAGMIALTEQSVVAPERFARVVIPGFAEA